MPATPGLRLLTEKDAGKRVELRTGDRLEVSLSGNPTTGYQWEVASGATNVVRQFGKLEYRPDSSAVGSGGTFIFTFEAAAPGEAALRLIYRRPFEKKAAPAEIFEVTVVVK